MQPAPAHALPDSSLHAAPVTSVTAPQLAKFALKFGDYEYFWLAIMGLAMSALVSMGKTTKGLLAAALGMLVSTVGQDPDSWAAIVGWLANAAAAGAAVVTATHDDAFPADAVTSLVQGVSS